MLLMQKDQSCSNKKTSQNYETKMYFNILVEIMIEKS